MGKRQEMWCFLKKLVAAIIALILALSALFPSDLLSTMQLHNRAQIAIVINDVGFFCQGRRRESNDEVVWEFVNFIKRFP